MKNYLADLHGIIAKDADYAALYRKNAVTGALRLLESMKRYAAKRPELFFRVFADEELDINFTTESLSLVKVRGLETGDALIRYALKDERGEKFIFVSDEKDVFAFARLKGHEVLSCEQFLFQLSFDADTDTGQVAVYREIVEKEKEMAPAVNLFNEFVKKPLDSEELDELQFSVFKTVTKDRESGPREKK